MDFSNFGSLKSTETASLFEYADLDEDFSNFGSLKSTETETKDYAVEFKGAISAISAR